MFTKKVTGNYLDKVPKSLVKEFTEEEGKITLLIPKFKNKFWERLLIPAKRSKHFRIHLDVTGSNVWRLIDGKRNVGEICNMLRHQSEENKGEIEFIEERTSVFLSKLAKNRFVKIED